MKIKKSKFLVFIVLIFFILSIFCCKKNTTPTEDFSIVASFYPMYIMLLNITDGIDNINISLLAPPNTGCLHDYQLTTKDMRLITESDAIIINGVDMEHFLEKVLDFNNEKVIIASKDYPILDENPHIWVSPKGATYQVLQIAQGLANLDPENAEKYIENGKKYAEKLNILSQNLKTSLEKFSDVKIITFHESFTYFAQEFDLDFITTIEQEHGTEPSPKEIVKIIDQINLLKNDGKKVLLFTEPNSVSSAAKIISNDLKLNIYNLDSAVTCEINKDAYITAKKKNQKILEEAFQSE